MESINIYICGNTIKVSIYSVKEIIYTIAYDSIDEVLSKKQYPKVTFRNVTK